MSHWERDLDNSEDSPTRTENLPREWRYRLNIDDCGEVIEWDGDNRVFWDYDQIKPLFDEKLHSASIPDKMQIERYDLNSDPQEVETILTWDKNHFIKQSLRVFEILNFPLEPTPEESLEIMNIRAEFNYY